MLELGMARGPARLGSARLIIIIIIKSPSHAPVMPS